MIRRNSSFVSALLPVLPLAFCHGCGGASETGPQGTASVVSAPASTGAANQAPSIVSRANDSVSVGQSYDWLPTAHDSDGDRLTFSANNLPPWASIDTNNGRITGTPAQGDEGIYEAITITVADSASHVTTTQPFSITVMGQVATGIASLQWQPPSSKFDGSPLDDLAGYRILYGRNSGDLDQSVLISDPAVTSYRIDSLPNGIWYFTVVAVSAGGLEGPPTTIASKSI